MKPLSLTTNFTTMQDVKRLQNRVQTGELRSAGTKVETKKVVRTGTPLAKDGVSVGDSRIDARGLSQSKLTRVFKGDSPVAHHVDKFDGIAQAIRPSMLGRVFGAVKGVIASEKRTNAYVTKLKLSSEGDAKKVMAEAQKRLADPSGWKELGPRAGGVKLGGKFQPVNANGKEKKKGEALQKGDFLKIDIPGVPTTSWVEIKQLDVGEDHMTIRVQASRNPQESNPKHIAHFFSGETENIFSLKREGDTVQSSVYSADELPNLTGNLVDKTIQGGVLAGAWAGGKDPQWFSFTKNLLTGVESKDSKGSKRSLLGVKSALGAIFGSNQGAIK